MKYDEYEAIAQTLTTENAPDVVKTLLNAIKVDTQSMEALIKSNDEKDIKIRDLQDTNIKLFLSQTGKADDEGTHDEPSVEELNKAIEDEISNLLKGE